MSDCTAPTGHHWVPLLRPHGKPPAQWCIHCEQTRLTPGETT